MKAPASRRLTAILVAAAAAAILIIALLFTGGDEPGQGGDGPTPEASLDDDASLFATPPPPAAVALLDRAPPGTEGRFPSELIYQETGEDESSLRRLDLDTGEDEVVFTAPSHEFTIAPGGDHVAYVTGGASPSNTGTATPATPPVLHIRDLGSGDETTFEDTASPTWSFDGRFLAVLQAGEPSPIRATISLDDMEVRPLPLPKEYGWTLIGWSGDKLMLFRSQGGRLYLSSREGSLEPIPTPDGEIRAPSPQGTYAVSYTADHHFVFQPTDGSEASIVDIDPWLNEIVGWTQDEQLFAAVASGFKLNSPSGVLVLDPQGDSYLVPATEGAVASLPTADGAGFLLVTGKTGEWSLSSCLPSGECRRVPATIQLGAPLLRLR